MDNWLRKYAIYLLLVYGGWVIGHFHDWRALLGVIPVGIGWFWMDKLISND